MVVLFKCICTDTTSDRDTRQDVLGHICVNFATPIHTGDRKDKETYILASEVRLVFYVNDEIKCSNPCEVKRLFDMGRPSPQSCMTSLLEFNVEGLRLTRDGNLEESTNNGFEDCDEAANS
ncbi:hypothetical protein Ahy_B04g073540 [Arachis hypogaea]|uniref:DUF4216 domain-containing protein n=1 Tax=Arachis hypogaea TaxID=3818 RepID=A0A444ZQP7_ARAHY|nr:hypothetical protein Ahy_B04g073540 [Arachis hypogaea]